MLVLPRGDWAIARNTEADGPFWNYPQSVTSNELRKQYNPRFASDAVDVLKTLSFTDAGNCTRGRLFGSAIPVLFAADALCLPLEFVDERFPVQVVSTGLESIILPLRSKECLEACRVEYETMRSLHESYAKCNILAFAIEEEVIHSRVFLDDAGFLEDPATGSANGCFAAYLLHQGFFERSCSYLVRQGVQMGMPFSLYVSADIDPELLLILFIAPLHFSESRQVDSNVLWKNRWVIASLLLGFVIAIAAVMVLALHALIPAILLAAAFALGSAMGSTDAVATTGFDDSVNYC